METLAALSERSAGKAAAQRLTYSWPEVGDEPENPTADWAAAAIEELGTSYRRAPAMHRAALRGAQTAAASLSPRPFQGILECLQNADDLGATELRVTVRREPYRELMIAHNGRPVSLADAAAMSLPWLSTKGGDDQSSGRFGIGQQTLRALGDTIEVHSPPFHFELHDDGPRVSQPASGLEGTYDPETRDTVVAVPLREAVRDDDIATAVTELGVRSLLFLRTVHRLVFRDIEHPERNVAFAIQANERETIPLVVDGTPHDVEHVVLRASEPPASAGDVYERYWIQQPVDEGTQRLNKATGETTPIGICICMSGAGETSLYDRVPLPVKLGFPMSLNAQFDPDSARTTILNRQWNNDCIARLGRLLSSTALHVFNHEPTSGWLHVPLRSEKRVPGWLGAILDRDVVNECHRRLINELQLATDDGPKPLSQITYPDESIEGLLTASDQRLLAPDFFAMAETSVDTGHRWRKILGELGQSRCLDLEDALKLFDYPEHLRARDPAWFVEIAAVAANVGMFNQFLGKASILLADQRMVKCPTANSSGILVEKADVNSLGFRLGVTFQIHPAYLADTEAADNVRTKLREAGVLVERRDEAVDALQLLAQRAGSSGGVPVRLSEHDVVDVRDAWAQLALEQRAVLGPRIGESVAVRVIIYQSSGKVNPDWGRPCDAYLPLAIDREQTCFAKAAGKTPGLSWIDPSYAKLLKTKRHSAEIGAQRLFVALGAAREPRLVEPPDLELPGKRDRRRGSAIGSITRPKRQAEALKELTYASHLLEDRWSPDLDAVVNNIRNAPAKMRVRRGLTLLSVLSRAWDRRYAEFVTAKVAFMADGKWHELTSVVTTWLARLSEAAWLPNRNNVLRPPIDLLLPAKTRSVRSRRDRSALLGANVEPGVFRSGILPALGLRSGPTPYDLIERLRRAQTQPITKAVVRVVEEVYQELADLLQDGERSGAPSMTLSQLRAGFAASPTKSGLLLANGQWHSPEAVFRGPPVFGSLGTFAPNIEGLDVLWRALRVPEPSLDDCIDVIRRLASLKSSAEREGVMVETLRTMAGKLDDISPLSHRKLNRLPLWTDAGWLRERPVYLADPSTAAAAAATDLRFWKPGLTSATELNPLAKALDVTRLRTRDFTPRFTAWNAAEGEAGRQQFVATVANLRDSLARDDIRLYNSLTTAWDDLYRARFVIDPELEICLELASGRVLTIATGAHMTSEPLLFAARTLSDAGSASHGGEAVASLFNGDRKKVAWAWASCWSLAATGEHADRILLPTTKPGARTNVNDRLTGLMNDTRSRPRKAATNLAEAGSNGSQPPPVRKLRNVGRLLPDDGTIVNAGVNKRGIVFSNPAKSDLGGRTFSSSSVGPVSSGRRPVLPSGGEREDLALEAVRSALRRDPEQICDLRARRGLGADAIDELRYCYEIKMSSSNVLPQDVTLTASEVHAAQTNSDFFLAIVTGLEEGVGELRVRFIFNPLQTLSVRFKGDLTLTGIPEAEALEFRFGPDAVDD